MISKDFHYHFGIHSNIPECCARYYQAQVDAGVKNIGATCRPDHLDKHWDIHYVTCDECEKQVKAGSYIPNKVHLCHREPNDDCKHFIKN